MEAPLPLIVPGPWKDLLFAGSALFMLSPYEGRLMFLSIALALEELCSQPLPGGQECMAGQRAWALLTTRSTQFS